MKEYKEIDIRASVVMPCTVTDNDGRKLWVVVGQIGNDWYRININIGPNQERYITHELAEQPA